KIEAIDADEDITLVDAKTQVGLGAELQGRKDDDNAASKKVNVAEPTVFNDEEVTMTMDQTLINMKAEKARLCDEQRAKSSKTNASNLPNVDSLRDRLKVADGNVDYKSQKIPTENRKKSRASKNQDKRNRESDHAEHGPTNFTLMAYTSSCSLNLDTETSDRLTNNMLISKYQIRFRGHEVPCKRRWNCMISFTCSSKNLSRLLDSQQSDKFKTGVGYDSQGVDSQVLEKQVNDKYNTCEGYHAVPPPFTRNFMPSKPNLVFADEHVISESVTSLPDPSHEWLGSPREAKISYLYVQGNPQQELQEKGVIDSGCSRSNLPLANAILDESNLWHRRLGHINFKTMNKLVRGNLVRGLPLKIFENNHTCVACQKGKQHKASETKDETNGILKDFIIGIENVIDHKVKIIRCDNGTKFKNKEMNQFCKMKGIRREFSVARTPQQNSIAERRNRTLIEVARTMLENSKLPTTFWAEAVNTACDV
nr:hypothetical protein [Tanacetum cinerariifolium]